jgi:hydrogenase nickel incorporation protein HypA/HybF
MHELSIACDLVEIAEAAARKACAERVAVVYLKLGILSGVVKEALLFGYDIATKGTLLEGSRLEIKDVALIVFCPACQHESQLSSIQCFECPICGNPVTEIHQGKELELTSMEIIEHENETA